MEATDAKPRQRAGKRLLFMAVIFAGSLAFLAIIEVILRIVGVEIWHNPLSHSYDYHVVVRYDRKLGFCNRLNVHYMHIKVPGKQRKDYINNFGMRQADTTLKKRPGVSRVAVVGDSITFGMGVPSYKDTYSGKLEQMLNAASSGSRWETLNFAVMGNSSYQVLWDLPRILSFQPDVLLVMIGNNDSRKHLETPDKFIHELISFNDVLDEWVLGSNKLVIINILKRGILLIEAYRLCRDFTWEPRTRVSADDFGENLKEIAETCKKENVKLYFIDEKLAVNMEYKDDKSWGDESKMLNYPMFRQITVDVARLENVGFINIGSVFDANMQASPADYDPRKNRVLGPFIHLFVEQDPIHPNIKGHRIIAETIFNRFEQSR